MLLGNAIGSDAESHTQWVNAVLNAMGMLLVDAMDKYRGSMPWITWVMSYVNAIGRCFGSTSWCMLWS